MIDDLDDVSDVPRQPRGVGRGLGRLPGAQVAPVDVAEVLRGCGRGRPTAMLTSATIPSGLGERLGLAPGDRSTCSTSAARSTTRTTRSSTARPTCPIPAARPTRRRCTSELEALITAAGGRTLALFTSCRAMDAAVDALRDELPYPVLTQRDLPKPALVAAFRPRSRGASSPPWGSSRASTCPARCRSSPSTGCRSPAPTSRCCRPAASGPGPTAFRLGRPAPRRHAAGPGRRPADPPRPTGRGRRARPRSATASYRWDIVRPCRRCAAPTARKPRTSCGDLRTIAQQASRGLLWGWPALERRPSGVMTSRVLSGCRECFQPSRWRMW